MKRKWAERLGLIDLKNEKNHRYENERNRRKVNDNFENQLNLFDIKTSR